MADKSKAELFLETFKRSIKVLAVVLVVVALFLAFMHHFYWHYGTDKNNIPASFFDLDSESTVCSWFASAQWFAIAFFALTAYYLEHLFQVPGRLRLWWLVVALVFLIASLDEASILHETVGELLEPVIASQELGGSIMTYFRESPWLVFYTWPLAAFIIATLWFLSDRLKVLKRAGFLCALGFALFVVALVIEFIQGMPYEKLTPIAIWFNTTCPQFYSYSVLIEETFENLGSASILVSFMYYVHHLLEVNLKGETLNNDSDREEEG